MKQDIHSEFFERNVTKMLDHNNIEYATHAYIAGLYDAFQIMAVLFPDKWDTDDIRELLAAKVNN